MTLRSTYFYNFSYGLKTSMASGHNPENRRMSWPRIHTMRELNSVRLRFYVVARNFLFDCTMAPKQHLPIPTSILL